MNGPFETRSAEPVEQGQWTAARLATEVRCGARPAYLRLKGVADRLVALAVLAVGALPLVALALWVRRDGHPALFRQTRAGRYGRPFTVYKFRTMRPTAELYGESPQSGDDPRITRLGRWLRESSLDELPQLINVLRGEMSLVGPRPLYVQQIAEWDARQRGRLLVKPGLTGLAQIYGRASITIEEKLAWDVQYVERVSLWTDIAIIWQTVFGVLGRAGIYETRYSQERARRGAADDNGGGRQE
jgi:undecaprenyl phosphate N,N'-diacetylbacillosamine 1-phosphate transferase